MLAIVFSICKHFNIYANYIHRDAENNIYLKDEHEKLLTENAQRNCFNVNLNIPCTLHTYL